VGTATGQKATLDCCQKKNITFLIFSSAALPSNFFLKKTFAILRTQKAERQNRGGEQQVSNTQNRGRKLMKMAQTKTDKAEREDESLREREKRQKKEKKATQS